MKKKRNEKEKELKRKLILFCYERKREGERKRRRDCHEVRVVSRREERVDEKVSVCVCVRAKLTTLTSYCSHLSCVRNLLLVNID